MDSRDDRLPPTFDDDEKPLGDIIRADPAPTLKYTIVGFAGIMAGVVIGYVFAHRGDSPAATASAPPAAVSR